MSKCKKLLISMVTSIGAVLIGGQMYYFSGEWIMWLVVTPTIFVISLLNFMEGVFRGVDLMKREQTDSYLKSLKQNTHNHGDLTNRNA